MEGVEIHPDTARELGIHHSEWVYIENTRGKVKFRAVITPTILPRVVAPTHSWWLPESAGGYPKNCYYTEAQAYHQISIRFRFSFSPDNIIAGQITIKRI